MNPALLKYREAAEDLHVSESTARRLGRRGVLDERRISEGAVRVTAESVQSLLRNGLTITQQEGVSAA